MKKLNVLTGASIVTALFLCPVSGVMAQGQASASSSSGGGGTIQVSQPPGMNDPSFQGSVPTGTASSTPIPLSLGEAIDRGLKTNLGLLTTEQSSSEVRAQRLRALAGLLPKVTGQLSMTEQQLNLQALGFNLKLPASAGFQIPTIVPPYSYQAALINANVPVFDYSAINTFRASREQQKVAALSVKNARDLVTVGVGNAYLIIIADAARITATQAQIDADNAVFTNATRRHDAGTAIGIDVLRSQVELKQRQQQLVAVQNQYDKDKLSLGRIIGLPVGQDFSVTDPSPNVPLEAMSLKDALDKAYDHRPDYQAAKAKVSAAQFTLRSSRAERYPTGTLTGYYGDEGLRLFTNSHGVFNLTGSVNFNIFDGGRIKADIVQNNAELTNRRNEMENLRGQIDFDVRSSLLDLKSASDQVDVAKSNLQLAQQSLQQSRDRFTAGVTNTVEVVQAQQTLAQANENLISAEYQYNVAKVELSRALGLAEEGLRTYFSKNP